MKDAYKIAYMGLNPITHGYQAALRFRDNLYAAGIDAPRIRMVGCRSHRDVALAVDTKQVDFGIIAIENSFDGIVPDSARILQRHVGMEMSIVCEIRLPINHYLVTCEQDDRDITQVHSHPTALGQVSQKIGQRLPDNDLSLVSETSTEAACLKVFSHPGSAAITTRQGADPSSFPDHLEPARLRIVAHGPEIHDTDTLCTRFLVLSSQYSSLSGLVADAVGHFGPIARGTVLFTLDRHKSGQLLSALEAFHHGDTRISVASIYPTPAAKSLSFEYDFLVDCDLFSGTQNLECDGAGQADEFRLAIRDYNESKHHKAKILGRYPVIHS